MFTSYLGISPVSQDYIWLAEYNDRAHLSEFDFDTKEEHSFYAIEKEKLARFGLIGRNKKMWFECVGGTFNLLGNRIDVQYRVGDDIYLLTNPKEEQKDIITYKRATAEANVGKQREDVMNSRILSYSFGYKTELKTNNILFNFKPIVTIPDGVDSNYLLTVDLKADRDLDGRLELVKNGKVAASHEAPIKADVTGRIHWKIG